MILASSFIVDTVCNALIPRKESVYLGEGDTRVLVKFKFSVLGPTKNRLLNKLLAAQAWEQMTVEMPMTSPAS